ncbi:MAG: CbiX/SirB N-terminal domain-containing protein [Thermoguttaceae bacterium]|nr:CbiX/SirB N-terminal domain-containing protein [Thermoguttaceae bacterium]
MPVIILLAHGSLHCKSNQAFLAMVDRIAMVLAPTRVIAAFLAHGEPNLPGVLQKIAQENVRQIWIKPYFLSNGRHMTHELPAIVQAARDACSELDIRILPTFENDPDVELLLIKQIANVTAME